MRLRLKMVKITFLGTGSAMVTDRFNTCFLVKQDNHSLMVDCGGGHEILKQLKQNKIAIEDIDSIFISHSHADHILGLPFIFRRMITSKKNVTIICSRKVRKDILSLLKIDIPDYLAKNKSLLNFHLIEKNSSYGNFCFFPVDKRQHGFVLNSDFGKIVFTGDVPMSDKTLGVVRKCNILITQAFSSRTENKRITGKHTCIEDVLCIVENIDLKKVFIVHTLTDMKIFSSETILLPEDGTVYTV